MQIGEHIIINEIDGEKEVILYCECGSPECTSLIIEDIENEQLSFIYGVSHQQHSFWGRLKLSIAFLFKRRYLWSGETVVNKKDFLEAIGYFIKPDIKIIPGGKGKGKTTEAIKLSHEKGWPIVSGNVPNVVTMACQLDINIINPIPFSEWLRMPSKLAGMTYQGKRIEGVIIDDVDWLFLHYFNMYPIKAITYTYGEEK